MCDANTALLRHEHSFTLNYAAVPGYTFFLGSGFIVLSELGVPKMTCNLRMASSNKQRIVKNGSDAVDDHGGGGGPTVQQL